MRNLRQSQRTLALLIATAFILPLCSTASAQGTISGSYEFGFDQNLILLNGTANRLNLAAAIGEADAANDQQLKIALEDSLAIVMGDDLVRAAMWRPASNVVMGREFPGVLLSNQAGSNANITSLEILISNPLGQFMPFANGEHFQESVASGEYYYFPNLPNLTRETVDPDQVPISANISDGGKRLAVSFGNGGIQPGRATTFNVYSSLGIQLENFLDEDTRLKVTYQNPDTGDTVTDDKSLGEIGDVGTFNTALMSQLTDGLTPGTLHFRSSVMAFSPPPVLVTNVVPEPASILLLVSGLGFFALRRRRSS